MPRIGDKFTDIAVYIYTSLDDARSGESYGGSGFIVDVPFKTGCDIPELQELHYLYVVTNRHVVKSAKTPVIRFNRKDGNVECVETNEDQWTFHADGDDVAVFYFDIEWQQLRITTVATHQFVTPQRVVDEDIGIGDDTVMIGRFVNHEGKQQNSPAVRFGNIAMMNAEKIETVHGIKQETFLVETRSLPGYSGSAVLIYSPCAMNDMSRLRGGLPKVNDLFVGTAVNDNALRATFSPKAPYLLGIDWCHIHKRAKVLNRDGKSIDEGWYVEENTGMAGVVPAWKIAEVLNCEELMEARREIADKMVARARKSSVSLDSATRESQPFTKQDFEDALKKASRKLRPDEK